MNYIKKHFEDIYKDVVKLENLKHLKLDEINLQIEPLLDNLKLKLEEFNIYYRIDEALIPDSDYDELEELYKHFRPNDEMFKRTGYQIDDNDPRKERLPIIMASMSKVKTIEAILKWTKTKNIPLDTLFVMTPKKDGLSFLSDEEHKLGWSKSDTETGRNATLHYRVINKNEEKNKFYAFGEAIIPKEKFNIYQANLINEAIILINNSLLTIAQKDKLLKLLDEKKIGQFKKLCKKISFKCIDIPSNPRNTASGFISKEIPKPETSIMDYIRYGIEMKDGTELSKVEQLEICNKINEVKISYETKRLDELTEDYLNDLFNKWSKVYELDGIIVEVNEVELRNKLGRKNDNTKNPEYARAYKGRFETVVQVEIEKIKRRTTKTGKISFVSTIPPTQLDGVSVENPTLVNASYVNNYKLFPGEIISIIRSGGVIPKVIAVNNHKIPFDYMFKDIITDKLDKNGKNIILTSTEQLEQAKAELIEIRKKECNIELNYECPCCNTTLEWNKNKTDLFCMNDDCYDKNFEQVLSFFKTLEVAEVGSPTIKLFFENGFNTVKKILNVSQNIIETFDRVGERKAEIIYTNIHNKLKNVKLEKLQHASCKFDKLGSKQIKLINVFISENEGVELSPELMNEKIDGIGVELGKDYLEHIEEYKLFENDIKEFIKFEETKELILESNKFETYNVVFTGIRAKDVEQYIIDNGGKIGSGVSKKTSHLVMKQKGSGSSKEKKAQKLNIPIYTLEEFKQIINN